MSTPTYIIFTDLDGTLLDHETYSYDAAKPAIAIMKEQNIPLILASSKTAAEIAPLRNALGFEHCPAIVENGSGLLPAAQNKQLSDDDNQSDYVKIIDILSNAPPELKSHYKSFSNWSADEISKITSLSPQAAKLAKQRDFSEPGLWSGNQNELAEFKQYLAENDIKATQGGRFLTLSFGASKADQMDKVCNYFEADPNTTKTVALGDAPNDIAMLEKADFGFIISNGSHSGIPSLEGEKLGKIQRSTKIGPDGWNECVTTLLRK